MLVASPSCWAWTTFDQTSGEAFPSGGQWISHRSTWSTPSLVRLSSIVCRSCPTFSGGSLVVRNTDSRSSPEAASALPMPASLPYPVAVSMCR